MLSCSRHGREGDAFSEPLDDPDGVQQPDVGVGRQGGEEGEDGRQEDAGAQQPLATDQLGEAATRSLAQHVAVEEGTENVALVVREKRFWRLTIIYSDSENLGLRYHKQRNAVYIGFHNWSNSLDHAPRNFPPVSPHPS